MRERNCQVDFVEEHAFDKLSITETSNLERMIETASIYSILELSRWRGSESFSGYNGDLFQCKVAKYLEISRGHALSLPFCLATARVVRQKDFHQQSYTAKVSAT